MNGYYNDNLYREYTLLILSQAQLAKYVVVGTKIMKLAKNRLYTIYSEF